MASALVEKKEAPLWHKVEDGITLPGKEHQGAALPMLAKPVLPDSVPSPTSSRRLSSTPYRVQTKKLRMQTRKKQKRKLTSRLLDRDVIPSK